MNHSQVVSGSNELTDVSARKEVGGSYASRLLLPSFSDALFIAVLIWLFAAGSGGWAGLLADADSGWHIRTGEWILENRRVPQADLFSFSKPGEPWYAWEWLSDVIYAKLHGAAGLKGVVLFSALAIAGFGTILFRNMIGRGATPFAGLIVALLVFGASWLHYLARPHILTLVGLTVSLCIIDQDRRTPGWKVWLLVPITAVWVNLHGGFLALIACLILLIAGTAATELMGYWLEKHKPNFTAILRYTGLLFGCACASLLNPYGVKLHSHIASYLRSDWIRNNIQEFQSPVFRSEDMLQFEVMLFLGLITVGWLVLRREFFGALLIVFWGHSALGSARHVPLFMIVSAPWVAEGATALWERYLAPAPRKSILGILASLGKDMTSCCQWTSAWIPVLALGFMFAPGDLVRWPKDYPEEKFPVRMVERYSERLALSRVLTMDQWADYLIYRHYPRQKVFVDGRSDFFGKDLGAEYLHMVHGHWDWASLLRKHNFDIVLSPVEWPLATLLKGSPSWRVIADDGQAILFERVVASPTPVLPEGGDQFRTKKARSSSNENTQSGRS